MMETGNKYGGIDIERVPCKVDTSPGWGGRNIVQNGKLEHWELDSCVWIAECYIKVVPTSLYLITISLIQTFGKLAE